MGRVTVDTGATPTAPTASARSERGRVRAINEDSILARYPVYLVADGMGGHARGDLASRTAIELVDAAIPADAPTSTAALVGAVHAANAAIRALGEGDASVSGTTLTGIAVTSGGAEEPLQWTIVNVGDSRVYSWDGRALTQLTADHSLVQELLDAGAISPAEALHHPERNTITRALGAFETVEVDVRLLPYASGQTFLICSDGVTKELPLERIEHLLAAHDGAGASLADAIVDAAVENGGRDNVSAIVVETGAHDGSRPGAEARRHPRRLEDTLPRAPR